MQAYLNLLREVYESGEPRADRTGTGTRSLFGRQLHFDLSKGFPLLTTKKVPLRAIIHELLWFLKGDTNIGYLHDNKVSIWDEWADKQGNLGPIYGYQWRHWGKPWSPQTAKSAAAGSSGASGIDQIQWLINEIRQNPQSRRLIVNAWNVADLPQMALPPCHTFFQFYVHGDERLSCQLYQRSADIFLGVPFNIASYALLTMMVAQVTGHKPGSFVHTFGDVHLYSNHLEQAQLQLSRAPKPPPIMRLNPAVKSIFEFSYEDFTLENYDPHPGIKADVAV